MCMDTAKSAKSPRGHTNTFEIGQLDASIVADHHILDMPLTIDERSDLSSRFVREFAQLSREFRGDNLVGRYAPSVQLFDAPQLIWFQPESVA